MGSLKTLVYELEVKAKKERDLKKKAEYHQQAAKTWRKIGEKNLEWERNWKWNLANYYYARGQDHLHSNEFEKAKRCLLTGEKLFLDLELRPIAFRCAEEYILASYLEEKNKTPTLSFLDLQESFLEKYKDFSNHRKYIEREHKYWNAKGKLFRREMRFGDAAKCYKNSVEIISKIDRNRGLSYLETYYKCKAMENKDDKDAFERYVNKAIEVSEERGNIEQVHYHIGLKYEILGMHSSQIEEKIEFLEYAKENYYKAKELISGKRAESLYLFSLSQKALEDGKYEKAIDLLEKTAKIVRDQEYPSNIPFPRNLESERYLYSAYLYLSKGEFSNAIDTLEKWLSMNKEIENTIDYASNRIIKMCIELFNREDFFEEDLYNMDSLFEFVRKKELGSKLYSICSLTYTYISLCLHNIEENATLERIKLETMGKITTEKVADNLKWLLDIGIVAEEFDWLKRLPPVFVDEFDKCTYMLRNILPDSRSAAIREFYVFLENYLKIIVFFNAEILWKDNWASKLEKHIANNQKPSERFTFGDFICSLRFFKDNNAELCKNIPEEIFELLEKHLRIRNELSHYINVELPKTDTKKDISKIINKLFPSFPTCLTVLNTQKSPWYDVEILWSHMPRRVSLYTEEKLTGSNYFIESIYEVKEKKLYPRITVPIPLSKSIEAIFGKS